MFVHKHKFPLSRDATLSRLGRGDFTTLVDEKAFFRPLAGVLTSHY
ncbi:hypothetical protein QE357_004668 [Siphonobacter sp. BAB-5404]|nr:hypothetical protein [Siphonobacter sp. SORGH_AS_0500]